MLVSGFQNWGGTSEKGLQHKILAIRSTQGFNTCYISRFGIAPPYSKQKRYISLISKQSVKTQKNKTANMLLINIVFTQFRPSVLPLFWEILLNIHFYKSNFNVNLIPTNRRRCHFSSTRWHMVDMANTFTVNKAVSEGLPSCHRLNHTHKMRYFSNKFLL